MAKGGGGSRGGSKGGAGGRSSLSGGAGSLNSYDKFEPVALQTIRELIDKSNRIKATGIDIVDVRDKIGDRASREAFDKNFKEMAAKGKIETVTGAMGGDIERLNAGGIKTELGGIRQRVRLAE